MKKKPRQPKRLKEKPRFFCDNCGCEVDFNTKTCPNCGRYFASIRCPACGFSGAEKLFVNGCPSCGYSAAPPEKGPTVRKKKAEAEEPLPGWVYVVSVLALLVMITILGFVITR